MMSGRTTPSSPRESSRRAEPRPPLDQVLRLPPKFPSVKSQNRAGVLKSRVDLEEDGDDEEVMIAVRPLKGSWGRWFIVDKDSDADIVAEMFNIRSAEEDAEEFHIEDKEKEEKVVEEEE